MTTDKNSGEVISLDHSIEFTHAYQTENPDAIKAFFAGSDNVKRILEQENCIGIRIYNGYDTTRNKANLVLVGVNEEGEDITNGIIVEDLLACPPYCPKSSALIKQL